MEDKPKYGEYTCPTCGRHWTMDDCMWEADFPSMEPKLDEYGNQRGYVLCCNKVIVLGYRKKLSNCTPLTWEEERENY